MATWTKELDALLVRTIRAEDGRYADAARAIARATRGKFAPHATTCLRRLRALDLAPARSLKHREASTRVDTPIPARVRAPLEARSELPAIQVLAIPLQLVDRRELRGAVDDALFAATPGWRWEIVEEAQADALACAKHRASLRGFDLVELERDRFSVTVAVREPPGYVRQLVLVVIRWRRS